MDADSAANHGRLVAGRGLAVPLPTSDDRSSIYSQVIDIEIRMISFLAGEPAP